MFWIDKRHLFYIYITSPKDIMRKMKQFIVIGGLAWFFLYHTDYLYAQSQPPVTVFGDFFSSVGRREFHRDTQNQVTSILPISSSELLDEESQKDDGEMVIFYVAVHLRQYAKAVEILTTFKKKIDAHSNDVAYQLQYEAMVLSLGEWFIGTPPQKSSPLLKSYRKFGGEYRAIFKRFEERQADLKAFSSSEQLRNAKMELAIAYANALMINDVDANVPREFLLSLDFTTINPTITHRLLVITSILAACVAENDQGYLPDEVTPTTQLAKEWMNVLIESSLKNQIDAISPDILQADSAKIAEAKIKLLQQTGGEQIAFSQVQAANKGVFQANYIQVLFWLESKKIMLKIVEEDKPVTPEDIARLTALQDLYNTTYQEYISGLVSDSPRKVVEEQTKTENLVMMNYKIAILTVMLNRDLSDEMETYIDIFNRSFYTSNKQFIDNAIGQFAKNLDRLGYEWLEEEARIAGDIDSYYMTENNCPGIREAINKEIRLLEQKDQKGMMTLRDLAYLIRLYYVLVFMEEDSPEQKQYYEKIHLTINRRFGTDELRGKFHLVDIYIDVIINLNR